MPSLVAVACFLPGQAKDLSAAPLRIFFFCEIYRDDNLTPFGK